MVSNIVNVTSQPSAKKLEVGNGHLEAAARYEKTDQENTVTGFETDFDLFSVSGGANYNFTDAIRIGGTAFRTERAPTSEELFSDGPHLATSQFEIGDINLGKETATGVEAVIGYASERVNLSLNGFFTSYDDYIFESETGAFEDGLPVFQFVGEDAEFYGFEAVGEVGLTTFGIFDISADSLVEFVRGETDTENLPRIPPLSVLSGLEAESDSLKLRAEWEYVTEADNTAPFELPTDSFNQVNAFLTWKAPVENNDIAFRFSVLNIFDAEARQHTSFLKDVVPLPGRNVKFSITAKL